MRVVGFSQQRRTPTSIFAKAKIEPKDSGSNMVNSRQKGAGGEREFAHWLIDNLEIAARRGQQFSGSKDSPDVVTDLKEIHFEVKRVQALNLNAAMEKAVKDGAKKLPVVAHRRDRSEWLMTVRAKDLLKICAYVYYHVLQPREQKEYFELTLGGPNEKNILDV